MNTLATLYNLRSTLEELHNEVLTYLFVLQLLRAKDKRFFPEVEPSLVQVISSEKNLTSRIKNVCNYAANKRTKQLPRETQLESWLACQFVPVSAPGALITETIVYSSVFNPLPYHEVFAGHMLRMH